MPPRPPLPALALVVALATSAGCPGRYVAQRGPSDAATAVVLDPITAEAVTVVHEDAARLPGGSLEVRVVLRNRWPFDRWVDVKVEFLDPHGFPLEATPWSPLRLAAGEDQPYAARSLGADAERYRLSVRATE
ncbi:MAG: hypothetical protein CVU56_29960 [Deltaproteobacteria bacterium HGW-Deltaproteobacteria-14]|jgi:hypothetical protein|nr:MAG: hypothetical protein CVU56_29960 [Deltaproteobacteria bacterium HGW-Deltaproteobacteria-14]